VVGAGFVIGKRRTGFTRRLGSAVLPYGVLTVGLLLARALHSALPSPVTEIIASPPFWLAAACLIAAVAVDDRRRVSASAARSWIPIGVGTSAFMLMGWIMTTTGMSEAIGAMLPAGLVLLTPWLNAVGAVLTGSNTGANSMFTGTLTAVAASSHVAALPVVAAGNAAGSLAALAAPPRVAMAVQMADASAPASKTDIARGQGQALAVSGINALIRRLCMEFFVWHRSDPEDLPREVREGAAPGVGDEERFGQLDSVAPQPHTGDEVEGHAGLEDLIVLGADRD